MSHLQLLQRELRVDGRTPPPEPRQLVVQRRLGGGTPARVIGHRRLVGVVAAGIRRDAPQRFGPRPFDLPQSLRHDRLGGRLEVHLKGDGGYMVMKCYEGQAQSGGRHVSPLVP